MQRSTNRGPKLPERILAVDHGVDTQLVMTGRTGSNEDGKKMSRVLRFEPACLVLRLA